MNLSSATLPSAHLPCRHTPAVPEGRWGTDQSENSTAAVAQGHRRLCHLRKDVGHVQVLDEAVVTAHQCRALAVWVALMWPAPYPRQLVQVCRGRERKPNPGQRPAEQFTCSAVSTKNPC